MAGNTLLLLGAAVGGYFLVVKPMLAKNAGGGLPNTPGPANPPLPKGLTLPSNLSQAMQNAWNNAGSPGDAPGWTTAERVVIPTSDEALAAIYQQWAGFWQKYHYWPIESDLRDWVNTAIANYASS